MILVVDQDGNVVPAAQVAFAAQLEAKGNNVFEMSRLRTTEPPTTQTRFVYQNVTKIVTRYSTNRVTEGATNLVTVEKQVEGPTQYVTAAERTDIVWHSATVPTSDVVTATRRRYHTAYNTQDKHVTPDVTKYALKCSDFVGVTATKYHTVALAGCPGDTHCTDDCASQYTIDWGASCISCDDQGEAGGTTTVEQAYDDILGTECNWDWLSSDAEGCEYQGFYGSLSGNILCGGGSWSLSGTHPAGPAPTYQKDATVDSCPNGTYDLTDNDGCADFPSTVSVYS